MKRIIVGTLKNIERFTFWELVKEFKLKGFPMDFPISFAMRYPKYDIDSESFKAVIQEAIDKTLKEIGCDFFERIDDPSQFGPEFRWGKFKE